MNKVKTQVFKLDELNPAKYNPRKKLKPGDKEFEKLKNSIQNFGYVELIVVNVANNNTVISGHQRLSVLKHMGETEVECVVVEMNENDEKALNIAMNNPNAQGTWNRDKLAEMIPDIDYKDVGLSEADLSLLGLDYMFQTEQETNLADSLADLMQPVEEEHKEDLAAKQAERAAKVAHMKEVKAQVREASKKSADNMDAYIMLSFDNIENKNTFLQRFGFAPDSKYIKGEDFDMRCEAISEE